MVRATHWALENQMITISRSPVVRVECSTEAFSMVEAECCRTVEASLILNFTTVNFILKHAIVLIQVSVLAPPLIKTNHAADLISVAV
jgi:hypothetical protein